MKALIRVCPLIIIFSIVLSSNINAQTLERHKAITAYIYNFANNIQWQNEETINEFKFLLIGEDKDVINEMKTLSNTKTLRGKPINIVSKLSVDNVDGVQLIYITKDNEDSLIELFDKIEGKNILLISDDFQDKRLVMINFIEGENETLRFEINKANIINQNLRFTNDLVLFGGTEIDVAALYREGQQSLRSLQKHTDNLENDLVQLEQTITSKLQEIQVQKDSLDRQMLKMLAQNDSLNNQTLEITEQQKTLSNQSQLLEEKKINLSTQARKIQEQQNILDEQYRESVKLQDDLNKGNELLQDQKNKILSQTKILEEKTGTINKQQNILYLLVIIISLVIILVFLIYYGYKNKQKLNKVLESKVEERTNELRNTNEKLLNELSERKLVEEKRLIRTKITNSFLSTTDEEMFSVALKVILEAMNSPFGVFGYIDDNGGLVVPTMTRHVWDKCQVEDKTITFPLDTWGCSSWPTAIKEKRTIYSNEKSIDIPEGHVSIHKHISMPIMYKDEVVGLFQVANKKDDYSDADIRLLAEIAQLVAPILSVRLNRERTESEINRLNAELEQKVVERTSQLETANKELEAFSYSVSHDLRAPLRHINGYIDLLNRRLPASIPDKAFHYLSNISDSAIQMSDLIDDLLQFSRTNRQEMLKANVDMSTLVQEVLKSIKQDITKRKIEWAISSLPNVYGDYNLLTLVWHNLLSNAVKFTKKRDTARIEIEFREDKNEFIFIVRDNGAGFDMQYANKLFGVFQRLHSIEEYEGTGIGLANVSRIILRHGGRTWAEAEVDKGATFYFTLIKESKQ